YDWTCTPPPENLSPHIQLVRSVDWASTALGPMESWPPLLRFMCNLVMSCPNPAIVFWGPELNMIYNEAYPPLAGDKHPTLIGAAPWVGFAEAWADFEPFFRRCEESGRGAMVEDMLLFLNRGYGPFEETYYSFSFTPILAENDTIVGWYETVFETTKQKITERRISTLLTLGDVTSKSQDLENFWPQVIKGLNTNPQDIAFSVIYSVSDSVDYLPEMGLAKSSGAHSKRYDLVGSSGVPVGHTAVSTGLDITLGRPGFTSYFAAAAESEEPIVLRLSDSTLPPSLVQGIESHAWSEPVTAVVICAISPATGRTGSTSTALGYLVMGLNSHRPFDEEYKTFVQILTRQVTTAMASVLLIQEEAKRGRTIAEQAAIDQQKIEEQLRVRTRELEQSEMQLKHFADAVPTGIFVLEFTPDNMQGSYRYRNDKWFELTGDCREDQPAWQSPLWEKMHPEDVPNVQKAWKVLMDTKSETSFEFRVPRSSRPGPVDEHFPCTWILCYAFSLVSEDGWLRSIIGSVTDITSTKWAEGIQKQRMEDAIEAKRQQENFIDVTSHEMRNPLSAIMISADDIMSSLRAVQTLRCNTQKFGELVEASIEAAQTVLHCAQHQKRIVDDILTISKLDSGLFSITPVESQPTAVVSDIHRMFAGEYNAAGISHHTEVEQSYRALAIDWVMLDSSRLQQILINLVTNSIKFTQYEENRVITVSVGASLDRPSESSHGIKYLELRKEREDLTQNPEWGDGGPLYLHFSVQDTGCGLTVDEKKLLFMRFSQAPRTHVNYGGSGLGLFICRELTELQGGAIGVVSETGKGSTFSFYIKARRLKQKPPVDLIPPPRQDLHAPSPFEVTRTPSPTSTHFTPATSTTTSFSGPRTFDILIVEDNKINQQVMSKGLVKLGHAVTIANHGVEALDFLRTTRWWKGNDEATGKKLTVVLMDIEMPVMDGLTCVRTIREREAEGWITERINVIAITANARVEQVNTALEAGMDDVVSKPFRVAELTASIERLLDQRSKKAGPQ
ncbi:hypothetical protein K490DRAFT_48412, partial [Saccharata proteae CBS 121410]